MNKLDEILKAIVVGGGGGEGNHTLRWDQNLGEDRFVLLQSFDNQAVLDKETGLVWEQLPDANIYTWHSAKAICANKNVGGEKGWRLPSFSELASLIHPSSVGIPGPTLQPGHPFTNVQTDLFYWSATTVAGLTNEAWHAYFSNGMVSFSDKDNHWHAWCVRGGHNDGSEY